MLVITKLICDKELYEGKGTIKHFTAYQARNTLINCADLCLGGMDDGTAHAASQLPWI